MLRLRSGETATGCRGDSINQMFKYWSHLSFNQMVKERAVDLDAVFAALAHPIRRAMLERLAEGDCSVGDLAEPHDVSLPAISKQIGRAHV